MKAALILAAALALSGCAEIQAQQTAQDDAQCRSYGLVRGSQAYADCRMRIEAGRDGAARQALASTTIKPIDLSAGRTDCIAVGPSITCRSY